MGELRDAAAAARKASTGFTGQAGQLVVPFADVEAENVRQAVMAAAVAVERLAAAQVKLAEALEKSPRGA
jgi:hypothetical protein